MRELNSKELLNIYGGATTNWLTATFINAAARILDTIMDVGRSLGTAIRRTTNGSICPL